MLSWIRASKTEPDLLLLVSAKKGRLDKVISALTNGATVEAKDKVSDDDQFNYPNQIH